MQHYDLYIDGAFVKPAAGRTFDSTNPYSGEVWAQIGHADATDVDRAVAAAKAAFPGWSGTKPHVRARHLLKLADLIDEKAEFLAEIEVRDNGKLYAEMLAQCRYLSSWYRYYAGLADKIEGTVPPVDKANMFAFTRSEPYGVVALITAWNSPLLMLAFKLAPSVAAGNTAVVKPSEFTSASTLEFMKLVEKAGIPKGVVNVVTGFGADVGSALVAHPDIAKISFTGSDVSGQKVYETAAKGIKRVALELGGKSPNIVFEDADMESAVMGAISGIFAATGQTCIAGSRLLLQRSIHDKFVERLVEVAGAAKIGDPMHPDTNISPVANAPQYQKILQYIDIAKKEGANCVLGGGPHEGEGHNRGLFVKPTIFTGVRNDMRIAQEEVFGPVLGVIPFDDEQHALSIANDIRFGLAAGVWTRDVGRIFRMSEKLQVGTVWVNTYRTVSFHAPFGGTKRSGVGRENGIEGMKEFLQTKTVYIATETAPVNPFIIR